MVKRRAALLLALLQSNAFCSEGQGRRLEVADAIATTRYYANIQGWNRDADGRLEVQTAAVNFSPSGSRFAVFAIRGDLRRDRLVGTLLWADREQLESGKGPLVAAQFVTDGKIHSSNPLRYPLTLPIHNEIRWLDDRRITLKWEDSRHIAQAFIVDVESARSSQLTAHPSDVFDFGMSSKGDLLYSAQRTVTDTSPMARGFTVENRNLVDVLRGSPIAGSQQYQRFIRSGQGETQPISVSFHGYDTWKPQVFAFTPDGEYAVIDGTPTRLSPAWFDFHGALAEWTWMSVRADPGGAAAKSVRQLYRLHVPTRRIVPLIDAPLLSSIHTAWSPDSHLIAFGPSHFADGSDAGKAGEAFLVVDVTSLTASQLPLPRRLNAGAVERIRFESTGIVELRSAHEVFRFRHDPARWSFIGSVQSPSPPASWVEVRESANQPPALYEHLRDGALRLLHDPNSCLAQRFALGKVREVTWTDRDSRMWRGLLYEPAKRLPRRRYPLVIQNGGYVPVERFSLYGFGPEWPRLGPGISVFAAQVLASRGIAVLQLQEKMIAGVNLTPAEPAMYTKAYESAVDFLAHKGLIDPSRVGLVGYSRTGWWVQHALAFADFPYAAAVVDDGSDGGYLQHLAGGDDYFVAEHGAVPFAAGLRRWLEQAPPFNADRVRAPLRLQVSSLGLPGILSSWEMYARLRELRRRAELFVIPDIEHGSHALQNPLQVLTSQEGTVDWFDFWLNGREDASPRKVEQYQRWHKLRKRLDESPAMGAYAPN